MRAVSGAEPPVMGGIQGEAGQRERRGTERRRVGGVRWAQLIPAVSPACPALWFYGGVSALASSWAGHMVKASGSLGLVGGRGEWTPVRCEPALPLPSGRGRASRRSFRRSQPECRSPGVGGLWTSPEGTGEPRRHPTWTAACSRGGGVKLAAGSSRH